MAEWKSLPMLLCEYTESKQRLTDAIARTRQRAEAEPNAYRRQKLFREAVLLEGMRADLCYSIRQMQEVLQRGE